MKKNKKKARLIQIKCLMKEEMDEKELETVNISSLTLQELNQAEKQISFIAKNLETLENVQQLPEEYKNIVLKDINKQLEEIRNCKKIKLRTKI